MSGEGAAAVEPFDASGLRVAVVAASWHTQVMDGLLAGAAARLRRPPGRRPTVVRVPGAFELPVVASALAEQGYDAVVALGVVIRGGTPHFDYVCNAATDGLTRVALDHTVAGRVRRAHLRHRAAGARPRRARGVERGQGLRGDRGRAGHRPDDPRGRGLHAVTRAIRDSAGLTRAWWCARRRELVDELGELFHAAGAGHARGDALRAGPVARVVEHRAHRGADGGGCRRLGLEAAADAGPGDAARRPRACPPGRCW